MHQRLRLKGPPLDERAASEISTSQRIQSEDLEHRCIEYRPDTKAFRLCSPSAVSLQRMWTKDEINLIVSVYLSTALLHGGAQDILQESNGSSSPSRPGFLSEPGTIKVCEGTSGSMIGMRTCFGPEGSTTCRLSAGVCGDVLTKLG